MWLEFYFTGVLLAFGMCLGENFILFEEDTERLKKELFYPLKASLLSWIMIGFLLSCFLLKKK